MDKKSLISGAVFIGAGLLLLANNFDIIYFDLGDIIYELTQLWPLILIIIGGSLWFQWFKKRSDVGLVMPGTILLTYGLLFLYVSQTGWWQMGEYDLWAFFIIGPGLGLLAMYFLGKQESGLLFTGSIVTAVGVLFLIGFRSFDVIWPVLLIAFGMWLILKDRNKNNTDATTFSE